MKIEDFEYGALVKRETISSEPKNSRVGMIIGIGENAQKEILLKVDWSNSNWTLIHPANVDLF